MSLDEIAHLARLSLWPSAGLADSIEGMALNVAKVQRDTNCRAPHAALCRPSRTAHGARSELQLTPYIAQLCSIACCCLAAPPAADRRCLTPCFKPATGRIAFLDNRPLSGEFLLGFHSQREALRPAKNIFKRY